MRLTSLIAAVIMTAAPLAAFAKDDALAKAIAGSHRTPAMVERDKFRHS